MRSILIAISVIVLPCYLISAEPSAFGAGNLDNPTPYGLTSSEKVILENKKNLHKFTVKTNNQADEVESLRGRIDGLQTIIESLSTASHENKLDIKSFNQKSGDTIKATGEFNKRLAVSIKSNNDLILVNTKDIQKINLVILEMSKLIDVINSKYVSKNEFDLLVSDVNKFKDLVVEELKKNTKVKNSNKESSLDNMTNDEIANEAKSFYDKKFYTKSIEYYNHLIKKNYKPAYSHYMVGEMNYYRKNYADAIAYFKKSASLYSKASYMPYLMLHTAISMDKSGDVENAKKFYNAVILKYPDSSQAEAAKKIYNYN